MVAFEKGSPSYWGLMLIELLLVVALTFWALNGITGYFNKMKLLTAPCQLCIDSQPAVKECFIVKQEINGFNLSLFPGGVIPQINITEIEK